MSEKKDQIINLIKEAKPKTQNQSKCHMPAVTHWHINESSNIAVGGDILIAPNLQSSCLPYGLVSHEDRLQDIFFLLSTLDPQKQKDAVDEFYRRLQEAKRLDELEQLVREMGAEHKF